MKLKVEKIKYLINDRTISEISELSNVSRNWLSTVINRGNANMRTVNKLARALEVDPEDIIYLEE